MRLFDGWWFQELASLTQRNYIRWCLNKKHGCVLIGNRMVFCGGGDPYILPTTGKLCVYCGMWTQTRCHSVRWLEHLATGRCLPVGRQLQQHVWVRVLTIRRTSYEMVLINHDPLVVSCRSGLHVNQIHCTLDENSLLRIGGTTTPLVIGLFLFFWHSSHRVLYSSNDLAVMFAYLR